MRKLGLAKEWEMSLKTYKNAGIIVTLAGRLEFQWTKIQICEEKKKIGLADHRASSSVLLIQMV